MQPNSYHECMKRTSYESRCQQQRLSRSELEHWQLKRLNDLVSRILPCNTFYRDRLSHPFQPAQSLTDLQTWPFTTKQDLIPTDPSISTSNHLTFARSEYIRFHQTSGTHGRPLAVLDTAEDWHWWTETWQFVLDAAEVSAHDTVLMAFSFGPFIGFWSANDAVQTRGALVVPSGGLSTEARLELILSQQTTVVCCTPSYALHLADTAEKRGHNLADSAVRTLIVAGEPGGSVAAIRQQIQNAWGADVVDHAGATEIGPWGFGNRKAAGLHVIESEFIAEFLRVGTDQPADRGELSELVLTSLGRVGAPVIRYRTGDLVEAHDSPADDCRFVFLRDGVLGRVDDMMIIRGVNIYPSAIEQILREFPEIREYRITATKEGAMDSLQIEVEDDAEDPSRIARALQTRLGLRVDVRNAESNSLPRFEMKGQRFIDRRHQSS